MRQRTRSIAGRALTVALSLALVAAVVADLRRPPREQIAARAAISAIHWYQSRLAGHLGLACRFTPTCSHYAVAVIERHGFVSGSWRAARRIARCGPWTAQGTVDLPD